jgi:hypothetical protein
MVAKASDYVVNPQLVSTSDEIVYTTLNYVLNTMNTDTTVQKLLQEFRYIVRQIYATKLGHTVHLFSLSLVSAGLAGDICCTNCNREFNAL